MNSTKDKYFLDSNILIYAHTNIDLQKRLIAQNLGNLPETYISTQVCTEFVNAMRKKFKIDWEIIEELLTNIKSNFPIHTNTENTISDAIQIAKQYHTSWYDAVIVSAALESGCTILYSEDFTDGQIIDGILTIQNPFL